MLPPRWSWPSPELLHPEELERCRQMPSARRRQDWFMGRLAAKFLVKEYLQTHKGMDLPYSSILIRNTEAGSPHFYLPGQRDGEQISSEFNISLSHSHGRGLAGLSATGRDGWIGIDLERITQRSPMVPGRILTHDERQALARWPLHLQPAFLIAMWSLKEAAMKALQARIRVEFQDIEIQTRPGPESHLLPGAKVLMRFTGKAERWLEAMGGGAISAQYCIRDGFAYALVRLAPRPEREDQIAVPLLRG